MKSYSEWGGVFVPSMVRTMRAAEAIVDAIPNTMNAEPVRCHEVARVVHRCLTHQLGQYLGVRFGVAVEVFDGVYHAVDHSWLVLTDLPLRAILDPYAVGRLPAVQLVSPSCGHANMYEVRPKRTDIRLNEIEHMCRVVEDRLEATTVLRW